MQNGAGFELVCCSGLTPKPARMNRVFGIPGGAWVQDSRFICLRDIDFHCVTRYAWRAIPNCSTHGLLNVLERLDRIIRPIAVPNLTMFIIAGQLLMYLASLNDNTLPDRAELVWDLVLAGEVWRLLTFFFIPFSQEPIFLIFAYLIFYMMGNALEAHWGVVRYNVFLWLGAVLTIAVAGIVRDQAFSGRYLQGTVFLAFATFNPDFELRLFFVLPVKVKWLALIQVAGYLLAMFGGSGSVTLMVLASVGNYLVFFGPGLVSRARNTARRAKWERQQIEIESAPRHTCTSCGVNSKVDPKMEFRYCSKCEGEHAYCMAHLRDHQHKST